jgi:hypothetical protein
MSRRWGLPNGAPMDLLAASAGPTLIVLASD